MRKTTLALAALLMFSGSAIAGDLTLTLDSPTLSYPPGTDTTDCQIEGAAPCIFFTGTITDSDTDDSLMFVSGITITFTDPTVTDFNQDNAFYDFVPGLLSGDPNWATDNSGNPANSYTGVIFGLEFPANAPAGTFAFTAQLQGAGGTNDPDDNGIVSNTVTSQVAVAPEPFTGVLPLSALPVFAVLRRRRSRV